MPYHNVGIRKNIMGISQRSCVTTHFSPTKQKASKPAQDQAARPTGVQDVQVVRLLFGIKRGDERIDGRFAHAVGQREHEHADVQAPVRGVLARHDSKTDVAANVTTADETCSKKAPINSTL